MRYPVDEWPKWYSAKKFGERTSYGYHDGEDINLETGGNTDLGKPIKAIADGQVTSVHSHKSGFGNHIHIKHTGDWGVVYCHYAHCDTITVSRGDLVKEGQVVATIGKSGNSKYAHLHWSIKLKPTGIDGIARTRQDLVKWTSPIPFVEKWMGMAKKDIRLKILDEEKIKTEGDLREAMERNRKWDQLQNDNRNANIKINLLQDEIKKLKSDLQAERDANLARVNAEKEQSKNIIKSVAEAVGSNQSLPEILQSISILRSAEQNKDKAERSEKQSKEDLNDEKLKHAETVDKLENATILLKGKEKELKDSVDKIKRLETLLNNTKMAKKMVVSPKFKLVKEDWVKIGKGAGLAMLSALALYLYDILGQIDFGTNWYTPIVVAVIPVIANTLKKWASENKYK